MKSAKGEILEKSDLASANVLPEKEQSAPVSKSEYYKKKFGSSKSDKPKAPKKKMGHSDEESIKMFKAGKSINEIAAERELSAGTIVKHLCTGLEAGQIGLKGLLTKEKILAITKVLVEHEENTLTEQKDMLGPDYSYDDFRMVIARRKAKAKGFITV